MERKQGVYRIDHASTTNRDYHPFLRIHAFIVKTRRCEKGRRNSRLQKQRYVPAAVPKAAFRNSPSPQRSALDLGRGRTSIDHRSNPIPDAKQILIFLIKRLYPMVGSQSEELSKDEMEKKSQLSAGANARESAKEPRKCH